MATLTDVPAGGQLYLIGDPSKGQNYWYHIVYTIPGTNTRMVWAIPTDDPRAVEAFTNSPNPTPDRTITWEDFQREGMLHFGTARELTSEQHPFDQLVSQFEDQATIRPWLRDPEMLAILAGATMEGRPVSDAELQTTQWWRSRNASQRQWAEMLHGDPVQAERVRQDNRIMVTQMLRQSGLQGVPQSAVDLIADRFTVGDWSETYLTEQTRRLANPNLGAVDVDLGALVGNTQLRVTTDFADDVRQQAFQWLGPVHGKWEDSTVQSWAARLATEEGAEDMLTEELKRQRLGLFPEHQDPTLDYESLAQPWRGVVSTVWGQMADETDAMFERIIRLNDRTEAEALLRQEGLKRGVRKVAQDGLEALSQAFTGTGVRRAI